MVRFITLFLLFLIPRLVLAESVIAWEADPAEYKVIIQKDGEVVLQIETMETEVKLDIAPGGYLYQVQIIDPFGNIVSTSDWLEIRIQDSRSPYFRVIDPVTSLVGDSEISLSISGNNLGPEINYYLVQKSKSEVRIPIDGVIEDNIITFWVDITGMEPGNWGLLAETPEGKMYLAPNALRIETQEETQSPEAEQELWMVVNKGNISFEVDADFNEKTDITIKGPDSDYTKVKIITNEEGETLLNIDVGDAESGQYSVILEDVEKGKAVEENVTILQVKKPPTWFRLRAGFNAMLPLPESTSSQAPEFIAGVETSIDVKSGWSRPFLKNLGMELHGMMGAGPDSQNTSLGFSLSGMMDLSFFWRPETNYIVPFMLFGIGNLWMNFTSETSNENLLYLRLSTGFDLGGQSVKFFSIAVTGILTVGTGGAIPMIGVSFGRGLNF